MLVCFLRIVSGEVGLVGLATWINFIIYRVILIHAGTNDIWDRSNIEIFDKLMSIVHLLKVRNPQAKVLISSILPCPRDDAVTHVRLIELNQLLKIMAGYYPYKFIASFHRFIKNGRPYLSLFRHDGLH